MSSKTEEFSQRNEKWRKASQKVVDLRFLLEDILHLFNEDERQSERFQQLIKSIREQVNYVLDEGLKHRHIRDEIQLAVEEYLKKTKSYPNISDLESNDEIVIIKKATSRHKNTNESPALEKKKTKETPTTGISKLHTQLSFKLKYVLVATFGAVLLKFIEILPTLFSYIWGK